MADLRRRMTRGLEKRRLIFGESDEGEWTDRNDSFDPEFQEYMLGFRWGTITARPGLDDKTRQLCAVATFLSLGNYEQIGTNLERQIEGALRCGASPQEVVEVILQTGLWVGIYKWAARKIALKVFRKMGYTQGVDWGRPQPARAGDAQEQGLTLRRQVMGTDDEAAWTAVNDAFDPEFNDYLLGFGWGTIASRSGLDLRTRLLCSIGSVLALANFEQVGDTFERLIRGALRSGATPQEIVEVILQTGLWAGIYKWHGRKIALRVFREMGYTQGVDWARPLPEGW